MAYEIQIHENEGQYFGTVTQYQNENDWGKELLHRSGSFATLEEAKEAYSDFGQLAWSETQNPGEPRMWTAAA